MVRPGSTEQIVLAVVRGAEPGMLFQIGSAPQAAVEVRQTTGSAASVSE